jgi:hypothetical protein
MITDEIALLKKEIETLRAEIADVRDALKCESTNTTKHLNTMYRYFSDIHSYLMPVVHKVFPGYANSKKQIDAFMESYGWSPHGWSGKPPRK